MARRRRGWVTRKAIAAALDVNPRTTYKFEADGMPSRKRGRGQATDFEVEPCLAWKRARDSASGAGEFVDVARERARKEHAQALLAEQQYRLRAGELLEVEDVAKTWGDHIAAVRTKLLSWPPILANRVLGASRDGVEAIELVLEEAVYQVLTELAEGDMSPAPPRAAQKTKARSR